MIEAKKQEEIQVLSFLDQKKTFGSFSNGWNDYYGFWDCGYLDVDIVVTPGDTGSGGNDWDDWWNDWDWNDNQGGGPSTGSGSGVGGNPPDTTNNEPTPEEIQEDIEELLEELIENPECNDELVSQIGSLMNALGAVAGYQSAWMSNIENIISGLGGTVGDDLANIAGYGNVLGQIGTGLSAASLVMDLYSDPDTPFIDNDGTLDWGQVTSAGGVLLGVATIAAGTVGWPLIVGGVVIGFLSVAADHFDPEDMDSDGESCRDDDRS